MAQSLIVNGGIIRSRKKPLIDIQWRIFEPFFTTKDVGEGSGLGLDIAYRIVVGRHHGTISVSSSPGDTRFQVRLPIGPS